MQTYRVHSGAAGEETSVTAFASKPAPASETRSDASGSALQPQQSNAAAALQPNPWEPLLSAGLKLVEALAAAPAPPGNGNGQPAASSPWIETDAQTGRSYLKLPMPEPQLVQQLSDALSRLIAGRGS